MGFNDSRCAKCDAKIGWFGELKEKPPCHKCGHKPTEKELKQLEETERKMDAMRKKMLEDD